MLCTAAGWPHAYMSTRRAVVRYAPKQRSVRTSHLLAAVLAAATAVFWEARSFWQVLREAEAVLSVR